LTEIYKITTVKDMVSYIASNRVESERTRVILG
jgi:hypothetical protein